MAVDRIKSQPSIKQVESNSCMARKLHIRRETVWKVVKKFKETGKTCNRQGQFRKRTVRTKTGEKYEGKVEKEFSSVCCKNGCRSRNQSNFNASNPQRRPPAEPILTKCRKGKNFQPLMNVRTHSDVNTF